MSLPKTTTAYAMTLPEALAGERNDCSVRAHCVAVQVDYAQAHALFAEAGRVNGKGTCYFLTANLYERLGYERINVSAAATFRYRPTLAQFIRAHRRGRYVLHRNGHAFALVNGIVHDWARGTGARSRIVAAWRVA